MVIKLHLGTEIWQWDWVFLVHWAGKKSIKMIWETIIIFLSNLGILGCYNEKIVAREIIVKLVIRNRWWCKSRARGREKREENCLDWSYLSYVVFFLSFDQVFYFQRTEKKKFVEKSFFSFLFYYLIQTKEGKKWPSPKLFFLIFSSLNFLSTSFS